MNKFRLRASERDVDEAAHLLRTKKLCYINVFDPFGNEASVSLNTRKGDLKGERLLELDLWRTGCDFTQKGQTYFEGLGYRCGRRVIAAKANAEVLTPMLDKMLHDLSQAEIESFEEIHL